MHYFVLDNGGHKFGPADNALLEQWKHEGRIAQETIVEEAETGFRCLASCLFRLGRGKTVGIDLGTTNCVVAVLEDGNPTVITNSEGSPLTPGVVALTQTGEWLVGVAAKQQEVFRPEWTASSLVSMIGTKEKINIDGQSFALEEILAKVFDRLANNVEEKLGEHAGHGVITVPASFTEPQCKVIRDAARLGGIEAVRLITAPTAAALTYGLEKNGKNETILVYDLGGGTFDISVLDIGSGIFEVRSTAGDAHLGGDDFDQRIVDYVVEEFRRDQGIDLRKNKQAMQRLSEAAEKAKIELSDVTQTALNVPFIVSEGDVYVDLDVELSRAKFDELTSDLLTRTEKPFNRALSDAGISIEEVDAIILVGASTRIPAVRSLVKRLGGKEPNYSLNSFEAAAIGANIQAGVLGGDFKDIVLMDAARFSLGIQTLGDVFTRIIDRNTNIPIRKSEIFSTTAEEQTTLDIVVYQGERSVASQNALLSHFQFMGILTAPRGRAQIEVTIDVDADGLVNVTAMDQTSGVNRQLVAARPSLMGYNPHQSDEHLMLPAISKQEDSA